MPWNIRSPYDYPQSAPAQPVPAQPPPPAAQVSGGSGGGLLDWLRGSVGPDQGLLSTAPGGGYQSSYQPQTRLGMISEILTNAAQGYNQGLQSGNPGSEWGGLFTGVGEGTQNFIARDYAMRRQEMMDRMAYAKAQQADLKNEFSTVPPGAVVYSKSQGRVVFANPQDAKDPKLTSTLQEIQAAYPDDPETQQRVMQAILTKQATSSSGGSNDQTLDELLYSQMTDEQKRQFIERKATGDSSGGGNETTDTKNIKYFESIGDFETAQRIKDSLGKRSGLGIPTAGQEKIIDEATTENDRAPNIAAKIQRALEISEQIPQAGGAIGTMESYLALVTDPKQRALIDEFMGLIREISLPENKPLFGPSISNSDVSTMDKMGGDITVAGEARTALLHRVYKGLRTKVESNAKRIARIRAELRGEEPTYEMPELPELSTAAPPINTAPPPVVGAAPTTTAPAKVRTYNPATKRIE